jgi:hypothetical protein
VSRSWKRRKGFIRDEVVDENLNRELRGNYIYGLHHPEYSFRISAKRVNKVPRNAYRREATALKQLRNTQ